VWYFGKVSWPECGESIIKIGHCYNLGDGGGTRERRQVKERRVFEASERLENEVRALNTYMCGPVFQAAFTRWA